MKFHTSVLAASLMVGLGFGSMACNSTKQAGVTSDLRTQWTTVNADTRTTAEAARIIFSSDDLKNVNSDATDIDGKVTAKKANGSEITVNIKKDDSSHSELSVTVGMLGDAALGADYAARIKARAEGRN